ncbi:MAG: methyltransferase [Candidatus Aenigmarchaeota archaeon]|nr:methyltransferase [Candidatus Aenigmarchaeota archaeon]MDI6722516.1 methyltransferase [Candidatus Aenigmarchaeota archaeon]
MIPEKLLDALKSYIADIAIISAALLFYSTNSYYVGFLRAETQAVLFYLFAAYAILALPFYLSFPPHLSKGRVVLRGIVRYFREGNLESEEKVVMLFIAVKFFYIPLMLNFVFDNAFGMNSSARNFSVQPTIEETIINYTYPLALSLLFFIDTAFFTFGYIAEAGFLKNKVRSVEPTFLGWAVTLLTYPPLNSMYSQIFPWVANDYIDFGSLQATAAFRVVIILLVVVFVWATVSLGTKSSNLTNRGIVARGPYKYVRHPAYASKNAVWWLTIIPVISLQNIFLMAAWSFLYYMRAVTEERHLGRDTDYQEYRKKVKYKFIPRVW